MSKSYDKAMDHLDRVCDDLFTVESDEEVADKKVKAAIEASKENRIAASLAARYR